MFSSFKFWKVGNYVSSLPLVCFRKSTKPEVMHRTEYATSGGTNLKERGPTNAVPIHNYLSGDGKSHAYRGMAHYVPSELAWISKDQFRALPRETKRDAINIQSEDQWVAFMRNRDTPSGKLADTRNLTRAFRQTLEIHLGPTSIQTRLT